MKKSLRLISALAVSGSVAFFSGCNFLSPTDPVTPQEIVISPESLGKLAVATVSEQQSGAQFSTSGATSYLSTQNSAALPSQLGKSLGKTRTTLAGQEAGTTIDSSLISDGILKVMYEAAIWGGTSYDTLVVSLDSNVAQVAGSKVYTNGKIENYSVSDLDNDGVIAGNPAFTNTARFQFATTYTKAVVGHMAGENEIAILDVGSGPDHNFDSAADNQVLAATYVRMLGSDTLAYAIYSDADNDGILINNGAVNPSVVDVAMFERAPLLKPLVAWNSMTMRVVTNGDSTQDKVIRINGKEVRKSGRVSTFTVLDTTGDSTILAGEMAQAIWTTEYSPLADTIIQAQARIVYNPQNGINHPEGNLYYGIHLNESKRFGIISERQFDFSTSDPVLEGQNPTSGHIVMSVTYANGKTASLVADFAVGSFSGTYTGPEGNTLTVQWDANGNVVSSTATN